MVKAQVHLVQKQDPHPFIGLFCFTSNLLMKLAEVVKSLDKAIKNALFFEDFLPIVFFMESSSSFKITILGCTAILIWIGSRFPTLADVTLDTLEVTRGAQLLEEF